MKRNLSCLAMLTALTFNAAAAVLPSKVDFSHGMQDWEGGGAAAAISSGIDSSLGNGTPSYHVQGDSNDFSLMSAGPAFSGNYTATKSFQFSLDITVAELAIGRSGGVPLTQDLILEFRDYDKPSQQERYSSVWYKLGAIGADMPATQHFSVTVTDTSSNLLPPGWHGYGDLGPDGQDQLPYAQTFRRLLSDVDRIVVSTAVPGYVYGAVQYYDVSVDNIALAVPEPGNVSMLLAGLGLLCWVARRGRKNL